MKKVLAIIITISIFFSVVTVLSIPTTVSASSTIGKKYVTYKTINNSIKKNGTLLSKGKVKYPVLKSKSKAAKKINRYFEKKVKRIAKNIEKMAKTDYSNNGSSVFDMYGYSNYYMYDISVKLTYNQKGKYSFKMIDYEYNMGPHGYTIVSGYTFSKKTGKKITNSKLTKYNGRTLKKKIISKIQKKINKNPNHYFENALQIVKDYKINKLNCWLKGKYIYVYFNEYELSSYACGPTQIKIKHI